MAKELNVALGIAGLTTLKANTYMAGALVTAGISMTEIGATGLYYGDMTGAAGTYQVLFIVTGESLPRSAGQIVWDGAAEVLPTGDAFARLGAPAGASVSADVAEVKADTAGTKAKTDNLPASPAATGAAMTLTAGERTAVANEVEAQIIDETDSEKVLAAITSKIASVNPDLGGLTLGAIAIQVRTELAVELARIDAAITTRLATAGYTSPLDAAAVRAALGLAAANIDAQLDPLPTNADLATALAAPMMLTADYDAAKTAAPTASAIADQVWDEAIAGHAVAGSTGAALAAADAGGIGAIAWPYIVTGPGPTFAPIANADVWVTSDEAGLDVMHFGRSDQNGLVTFFFTDPGAFYFWVQKSGYTFANPDMETVL